MTKKVWSQRKVVMVIQLLQGLTGTQRTLHEFRLQHFHMGAWDRWISHRLSRVLGKDARTLDIQSKQDMKLSVRPPVIYTVLGSRGYLCQHWTIPQEPCCSWKCHWIPNPLSCRTRSFPGKGLIRGQVACHLASHLRLECLLGYGSCWFIKTKALGS